MPSTTSETTPEYSWHFEAIGTNWEIISRDEFSKSLKESILSEIESFDATYSRFRSDSQLRKLVDSDSPITFPDSAQEIFDFYDDLYALTDGKVTPLVGDALVAAGYDEGYSLKQKQPAQPAALYPQVVQREGVKLQLAIPTHIDIGAVGKGCLVDHITRRLKHHGHTNFVVDGSGDVRVVGERIERVGLEDPRNTDEVIGVVEVSNKSLCASAINRRAWGDWHHVIDPATGMPTKGVLATWVLADSTMIADGLATALFFVSPKVLRTKYTYEYIRMNADGSVEYSDYFAKGVFS